VRITVTEQHIREGTCQDAEDCMLARALEAATGRKWWVEQRAALLAYDLLSAIDLPPAATQAVRDFDAGLDVQPFEFELPVEALLESDGIPGPGRDEDLCAAPLDQWDAMAAECGAVLSL